MKICQQHVQKNANYLPTRKDIALVLYILVEKKTDCSFWPSKLFFLKRIDNAKSSTFSKE
jgi:hypothetical protein